MSEKDPGAHKTFLDYLKKALPMDTALFIVQFFKYPHDIGSLTPSSAALADAMTLYIGNESPTRERKNYLEAGAGTGAFTKTLIEKLGVNDHLDIIEINQEFCARLKKKYLHYDNVSIHAGSVLEWFPSYQYDVIVSSLPFNAFRAPFVSEILNHYKKLTKSKGIISYYEYMALPDLRKMFLRPATRCELQETLDVTRMFQKEFEIREDRVFANFPPAFVHHCQLP